MTNVSKQKLDPQIEQKLFGQFVQLLAAPGQRQAARTLDDLLGEAEKIMLVKRLAIILMLAEERSTYRIARSLHVSDATVRTIRDKYHAGEYDHIVKSSKKKEFDAAKFWKTMEVLMRGGMPSMGKDRWQWLDKQ